MLIKKILEILKKNKEEKKIKEEIKKKINLKKINRKKIIKIKNKIIEIKEKKIYKNYKKKEGKLVRLKVINVYNNKLILTDKNNNELIFNKDNNYDRQYKEIKDIKDKDIKENNFFKKNNYYYFLVEKIFLNKNKKKIIILKRNNSLFVKLLFKKEILEIKDNIVKIKKIVRISGIKTIIVVYSKNKNINAVGCCIGIKNIRLNNIKKELNNEIIEIYKYNSNKLEYINEIFKRKNIKKIEIFKKLIILYFNKEIIGKIIGKKGYNIKLYSLLLMKKIIVKEYEESNRII
ncbi:hypothetical protein [Candidatus Shikimatogenerans bostrichidophilus]|uniref:hypothetical protein n=1 Tax=Candidatus Shikimatogenerans bostrichidophilus TaxID=2943807 RepID=UPI0029667085